MKFLLVGLVVFFLGISNVSNAQYSFALGVNYVHAFGERTIDFQNTSYSLNTTWGYEITANNSYRFKNTKLEGVVELGYRRLFFSGSSSSVIYKGQSTKLIGSSGVRFLFSDKFQSTGYIEIENNLELANFNAGAGDLFRVSLSVESSYFITKNIGITLLLSRAMTPITEAYILTNPQYQTRLGLIYQFKK